MLLGFRTGITAMAVEPFAVAAGRKIVEVARVQAAHAQMERLALAMADIDEFELRNTREPGLPRRKIRAVPNPVSGPDHFGGDEKSIELFGRREGAADFAVELGSHLLVSVEMKDPRVSEGNLPVSVIALAGEGIERAD